jgi:protein SCO1/2
MKISTWGSLVVLVAALAYASAARAANAWGADYFPNVELTTQDGKVVHFYDDMLKGKAVAVNLIYTRCTASCPLETAKLSQVQRILKDRIGKDIFFVSISIDPKHDTPEALKKYAQRFHVGPGWTFLTGKKDDIRAISAKLGLSSMTDASNKDGHQSALMVGYEPTGSWMLNSAVDNPNFLARKITDFLDDAMRRNGVKVQTAAVDLKPRPSYAELGVPSIADDGEIMFTSKCSACHTIGGGNSLGPDLLDVSKRRERIWLANYILEPERAVAQHDPIAMALFNQYKNVRMPNLNLTLEDVEKVVKYIDTRSKASAQHASSP